MQGLHLPEVLCDHHVHLVRLGNGAVAGKHGERLIGLVPHVEPLLPPPFHRFGHGDVKIRIDSLLKLGVGNRTHPPSEIVNSTFESYKRRT
jgi:hypothetical protein